MVYKTELLASALRAEGFSPFDLKSCDPTANAERNLMGRTHYVDPQSRRFFRSKILKTVETDHGLLFALVESMSGDWDHTCRVFRFSVFDVTGTCIKQTHLESAWKSKAPAVKAMWEYLNTVDSVQVTLEALKREQSRAQRKAENLAALLAAHETV